MIYIILSSYLLHTGTQCEFLSSEFGMIHLSAGELLRNERASDSVNGKLIESYLKEGKIVPVQITIDLLRQAMEKMKSNRYLIDGFPRNWDNIRGWESTMEDNCDVEGVLFLDCPEEILESRILGRGLTSGRSDDNIDTIRKRFSTYKESTIPIVEYYDNLKRLIRVRGDQNKNMVFDNLKVAVLPLIEREILAIQTNLLQSSSVNNWDQYSSLCDTSVSTTIKSGSEVSNSNSFLIQSYLCLINIYIPVYITDNRCERINRTSNSIEKSGRSFTCSNGQFQSCVCHNIWSKRYNFTKIYYYHKSTCSRNKRLEDC